MSRNFAKLFSNFSTVIIYLAKCRTRRDYTHTSVELSIAYVLNERAMHGRRTRLAKRSNARNSRYFTESFYYNLRLESLTLYSKAVCCFYFSSVVYPLQALTASS
jgi:hypothetical protein